MSTKMYMEEPESTWKTWIGYWLQNGSGAILYVEIVEDGQAVDPYRRRMPYRPNTRSVHGISEIPWWETP